MILANGQLVFIVLVENGLHSLLTVNQFVMNLLDFNNFIFSIVLLCKLFQFCFSFSKWLY